MHVSRFHFTRRDLRLASGLTLFVYVAAHLANHALGLISVAAAERGLRVAIAVWHSLPGTMLLYGAVAVHISLALIAVYERRTFRMPPMELLRIALGFGIPTLLIAHAVTTRLAFEAYDAQPTYARIVWMLWHSNHECRQLALLVPGWVHGCLGLHFAFSQRSWFQRLRFVLFGASLLLPVLATLGFLEMLKEVSILAQDRAWFSANISILDAVQTDGLTHISKALLVLYFASIGAVLVVRIVRHAVETLRGKLVSITYPGRIVRVPRGWTVLEASRSHHIPHLSMCGGRARCSTCRVRVVAGADRCPPPAGDELNTLNRIRAVDGTRLACQLRPQGDVTVIPLLAATPPRDRAPVNEAVEREVAIMLVRLRWTDTPDGVLPQDLLYLLNRYSEIVGESVRKGGGVPIQFQGDGVTAVFGLEVEPKEANQQALRAARQVARRVRVLGKRLTHELGWAADCVIYLHTGAAGVGETGDDATRTLAAVGSTMDTARHVAAQHGDVESARIVVSEAVLTAAALNIRAVEWREIALPGDARLRVASIDRAAPPLEAPTANAEHEHDASVLMT